ncbi:hypothetical protein CPB85DRAFT_1339796 [Mucidula mucida]|nr:hypothetical protein CPB85DRAFT_1339796 [Mucidula mucida]
MSVPPVRDEMAVQPDRATTMSVPPERAVAAIPRERASSPTTMDEEDTMNAEITVQQQKDKDWWKTAYTSVSWSFHTSIVTPLLPCTLSTLPPANPAIDLNSALPGVRAALDTISRYEADVGFHMSPYPYPTSYVYTPPSPFSTPSPLWHTTLLHAFFDGMPSPQAFSPVSPPSSSSSSSSSSPPRTPTEDDPFVVRPPKMARTRKDMLDVLSRRGTPTPVMRRTTSGWIDVGPGWIDLSTPAVDISRPQVKQKQPRGGRRRRQPQPQPTPSPPQQQYGRLVGRDWR